MTSMRSKRMLLAYGLPFLVILSSIAIALGPLLKEHPGLALGITLDLTVLSPLLFLWFSRRTDIPKIRAVPIFILGILVASLILPKNDPFHLLDLIMVYIVPLVELGVIILVATKVFRALKTVGLEKSDYDDRFTMIRKSALDLLGKNRFTQFLASELAIFYFGLFVWKRKEVRLTTFTHYKDNGGLALTGALLALVIVETVALHLLLVQWSEPAAWVLTLVSAYTAIVIAAHLKALMLRPSILSDQALILKNGIIADIEIKLDEIEKIELYLNGTISGNLVTANLGLSKEGDGHNVSIHFKRPQTITRAYGFSSVCDILLLSIDNKSLFLTKVKSKILESNN